MNPLFFGSSDKALFGIYHAPAAQSARNRGVVVCNPFGDEAIKAHRALRELANRLAAERFHVLRFDYFGTGDSAGETEEGRVEQWIEDIGTAADELRDSSGVAKVSIVGLRLGGSLALQAAARRRDIDRVAMWDPIVRGKPYYELLRKAHQAYLREEFNGAELPSNRLSPSTGDEIMGYAVPAEVRAAIENLELSAVDPGKVKRAVLVTSTKTAEVTALADALVERGVKLQHDFIPVGINWNSDSAMQSSLVPTEAIEAIVAGLS